MIQGWIPKIVAKKIEQYAEKNGLKTAVKREIYIEITRTIMETNKKLYLTWIELNRLLRKDEGINMNEMRNKMKLVQTIKEYDIRETGIG